MTTTTIERQERLPEHNAYKLAIAVLSEQAAVLSKEDKDDFIELTKIMLSTDSSEERDSAMRAMDEILAQRPLTVLPFDESSSPSEPLQTWMRFISEKIRAARLASGLSQTQLAEKSGLTQSHVSRLENGEHSPNQATIQRIATALGIAASQFECD